MAINMVILPLTGLLTIQNLTDYIWKADLEVFETISKNIGQMAAFFAIYLMNTTFIFNCVHLLDLPHLFIQGF